MGILRFVFYCNQAQSRLPSKSLPLWVFEVRFGGRVPSILGMSVRSEPTPYWRVLIKVYPRCCKITLPTPTRRIPVPPPNVPESYRDVGTPRYWVVPRVLSDPVKRFVLKVYITCSQGLQDQTRRGEGDWSRHWKSCAIRRIRNLGSPGDVLPLWSPTNLL